MTIFSGVNIFSGVTVRSVLQRKTYTGQGWCHNYLARSLFGTWQPIKHRTNCQVNLVLFILANCNDPVEYDLLIQNVYQYPLPQEKNRICLSSIVVIGYFAARFALLEMLWSINTSPTMSEKTHKPRQGSTSPACLREAINSEKKDFFWNHFIKWWPPRPPFERKKEMILKVVWRVLMGVLRVFEGCCRVFVVCLKGVWKNNI